jgi:branched-subunit amino acid transport protein
MYVLRVTDLQIIKYDKLIKWVKSLKAVKMSMLAALKMEIVCVSETLVSKS